MKPGLILLLLAIISIATLGVEFVQTPMSNTQTPIPPRQRARELGIKVGILPTGELNAITDVSGVLIGQTTLVRGDNIRTGVTAVLPHNGNLFREKVPG